MLAAELSGTGGTGVTSRAEGSMALGCEISIAPRGLLGESRPWYFVTAVFGGRALFCKKSLRVLPECDTWWVFCFQKARLIGVFHVHTQTIITTSFRASVSSIFRSCGRIDSCLALQRPKQMSCQQQSKWSCAITYFSAVLVTFHVFSAVSVVCLNPASSLIYQFFCRLLFEWSQMLSYFKQMHPYQQILFHQQL